MTYANILVSVDLSASASERVRLAAGLTQRYEATLTGAAAQKVPAPILVQDIYDAQAQENENRAAVEAELNRAEETFTRNASGAFRTAWRPAFAGPITHLVALARGADIVVIGRDGDGGREENGLAVQSGPILMEAGRPVLVVPPQVDGLKATRIVVAWKDTVEARRAVAGALGFIRRAEQVYIVSVGDEARFEGGEDVADLLAGHGVKVTNHLLKETSGVADAILAFAAAQDADLIVTGAYGHSRLREWIFGGATLDLLQRSPVCCLMSH